MPRLFLELKNDNSAETWTMEGGRQYLVVKKEEILHALGDDEIEEANENIKNFGRNEAMKEMDTKIAATRSCSRKLGQADAWVLARHIACTYTNQQRKNMFGTADIREIMREHSYAEASEKVDKYNEKERYREIGVKDYVTLPKHKLFGLTGVDIFRYAVVIRRAGNTLTVLRCDGIATTCATTEAQRTGIICEDLNSFLSAWKED